MYAKLILVGNLGGEPSMRYTPAGQAVTNFSVAVNRQYTNSDGGKVEEVTWFRVAAWGKLGEVCNQFLSKGRQVLVEGRLAPQIRIWTGDDGQARASYEITAEVVRFLGGPRSNGSQDAASEPAPEVGEESIPF